MSNDKIFKDFDIYGRALIASKDCDPTYPVIRDIIKLEGFEPEWFAFVYVAFYNLESAIKMCRIFPTSKDYTAAEFLEARAIITRFGHERRGTNRSPANQAAMLSEVVEFIAIINEHKYGGLESPMLDSNEDFRECVSVLPFHGVWASFKIAEIFEKSLGYKQFKINDLGIDGKDVNSNDGSIGGLRWLFGREEQYSQDFIPFWNRFGTNLAKAWGVDIGEVETCLCKFHKLSSGKYFIGHDIQEFVELYGVLGTDNWKVIMRQFDDRFWVRHNKIDTPSKKTYLKTGEILNADYAHMLPRADILQIILDTE